MSGVSTWRAPWPPPDPRTRHLEPIRRFREGRLFHVLVLLLSLGVLGGYLVERLDPAPGGWIERFERSVNGDRFVMKLNEPASRLSVSTRTGQPCTTEGIGTSWQVDCPPQFEQSWQVDARSAGGTQVASGVWDRSRFWLLYVLYAAVALTMGSLTMLLVMGARSWRASRRYLRHHAYRSSPR